MKYTEYSITTSVYNSVKNIIKRLLYTVDFVKHLCYN